MFIDNVRVYEKWALHDTYPLRLPNSTHNFIFSAISRARFPAVRTQVWRCHPALNPQSRVANMIYFVNLCRKCKTIFYRAKWKIMMYTIIYMPAASMRRVCDIWLSVWLTDCPIDWLTDWLGGWLADTSPLANILLKFCNFAKGKLHLNWIVNRIKKMDLLP